MTDIAWVCGQHAVRHVLLKSPHHVLELWCQSNRQDRSINAIRELAATHGIACQEVPVKTLDKLLPDSRHQGLVLKRRAAPMGNEDDLKQLLAGATDAPLLLVLDGVQDPHNLGACLRVANGAGADAVVIPAHRGVGLTATVRKVASGGAETLPLIAVNNLARGLTHMKDAGVRLVGTCDQATQSLYAADLARPLAFILGAEDKGLRRLTREHCDQLVQIPMQGAVESLNVSTAAAVCLFESVRQKLND